MLLSLPINLKIKHEDVMEHQNQNSPFASNPEEHYRH